MLSIKSKTILLSTVIVGTVLAVLSILYIPNVVTSGSARDCDGNAVIYCGAYSTSELTNKITNGTGKSHQSGSELTALFTRYYWKSSDAGSLRNGYVYKNGNVTVDGRVVARNVHSMGRHYTSGSSQVSGVSYPLYLRHPSQSFISNSIPAFVYLNSDGSMRYAIIKSCGNIVPGVYREAPPRYSLTIYKYEDLNRNAILDSGEPRLSGWAFNITGPSGYSANVTTAQDGGTTVSDLNPGIYTVRETMQPGWESTTGSLTSVTITDANRAVYFGNARIRVERVGLRVVKFEDLNANGRQDDGENNLSGWQFSVSGPNGYRNTLITDDTGQAQATDLEAGRYVVTEVQQPNWFTTTGLTMARVVTTDTETQVFTFGNRRGTPPENPPTGGGDLPKSGPEDALPFAGAMAFSGGIVAWLRSKENLLKAHKRS